MSSSLVRFHVVNFPSVIFSYYLGLTVTVETMEKEQSLYLTDDILASIFKHDVSWTKAL